MTTYTNVFTGANIYASEVSFTSLALTGDVSLFWPSEAQPNDPVVSKIIEIPSATSDNLIITMPDARSASVGETVLFNNRTAYTVIVKDNAGVQIVSIPSSTQWQIYLATNTTAAGTWRQFQYAAGTSTANASALAGNGLIATGAQLQQAIETISFGSSFTLTTTDRAVLYNWEGVGAGVVVTLPDAATVGETWFCQLRNSGGNSIALTAAGSNTIDGLSSLTFQPGYSAIVACDGVGFFTVGLGKDAAFAFNYVTIDISGSVDYVLSGSELNQVAYEFTGVLGANVNVIVPATVQQYWVYDNTTAGSYNAYLTTQDQADFRTPLALIRGDRVITYCDGTDVVATQAASVSGTVNGGTF